MLVWCSCAAERASVLEPPQVGPVGAEPRMHDLERHPVLERLVLGLVDDPHAPLADLAEDAGSRPAARDASGAGRAAGSAGRLAAPAGLASIATAGLSCSISTRAGNSSRISSARSGQRATYSSRLGRSPRRSRARNDSSQLLDRIAPGPRTRVAHGRNSSIPPGSDARISLSLRKARMYRLLAADSWRPQLAGDLGVGQLLEMPQDQDLAVERVHGVEGLLQPPLPLGADRGDAGAGVAAQELRRQGRRGRLRPGPVQQLHLAAGVSRLDAQMPAVHELERHAGQPAQPEENRLLGLVPGTSARPCAAWRNASWSTSDGSIRPLNRWSRRSATMRRRRSRCGVRISAQAAWSPSAARRSSCRSSDRSVADSLMVPIRVMIARTPIRDRKIRKGCRGRRRGGSDRRGRVERVDDLARAEPDRAAEAVAELGGRVDAQAPSRSSRPGRAGRRSG